MAAISRREFVEKTAASTAVAGFLAENMAELRANPLGYPIGSQIYPHRQLLKDFAAFAKTMAEMGVQTLELCSPLGYGADFAALTNGKEVKNIMADNDMKDESAHFSMKELREKQSERITGAEEIGITQNNTATHHSGRTL